MERYTRCCSCYQRSVISRSLLVYLLGTRIFNLLFCVRRPLSKERIASNFRNVSKEEMDEFFRKVA